MLSDKKFQIEDNGDSLIITYKWFSVVAFFLVFFCVIWDGFLVFWFMIPAPLTFKLFAIIHVAVGIGLTYYTACLFVNRTIIEVSKRELSVSFAPLPWKGAKTIVASEIDQIYVKESINRGKNGTTRSYSLHAVMQNGDQQKILGSASLNGSEGPQFLEQKIEEFLGIRDRRVSGEYEGDLKPSLDQVPRKKSVEYNPTNLGVQNLLKGYLLTYDLKSWEVIYGAQFDWKNGESDKLYRLSGEDSSSMLLYVKNDMGLMNIFAEEKLESGNDTQAFAMLNPQNAPLELRFSDKVYNREHYTQGRMFAEGSSSVTELSQWFYISSSKRDSLRIVQYTHGEVAVFLGAKIEEHEISNILPSSEARGI